MVLKSTPAHHDGHTKNSAENHLGLSSESVKDTGNELHTHEYIVQRCSICPGHSGHHLITGYTKKKWAKQPEPKLHSSFKLSTAERRHILCQGDHGRDRTHTAYSGRVGSLYTSLHQLKNWGLPS